LFFIFWLRQIAYLLNPPVQEEVEIAEVGEAAVHRGRGDLAETATAVKWSVSEAAKSEETSDLSCRRSDLFTRRSGVGMRAEGLYFLCPMPYEQ
jgi:hypothetical protein